jgi:DMSO reductase anchor subunit
MPVPYPLQLELHADLRITRWRPLVQWLLVVPHLMIAYALRFVRQALTLISFFTVLFAEQIPRPLFYVIVMTYRYE